nr:hypothetical protein [Tanacetum cinerariifolium]
MEDSIKSDLRFDDAEGTACLLNEEIFEGLARMGYEKPSKKLTFYKACFFPQWKFMIHTILQCLSAKTTAWNEFSSTMASAIICLADNQKFNFSNYIFDNLVKSLEGRVKFYLFPRFLQVFLDKQVEGMARNKEMYIISSHTKKIFSNMRRIGAGFSGVITPLFDTMMVQDLADIGDTPIETHQKLIVDQPSTSKPQKKQKPMRKQRKEAKVSNDESEDKDHVPTPSSDPLPSGEDRFILNELMVFCTSLQEQVRTNDDEMFRVDDLAGEEVVVNTTTGEHKEQIIEDVSTVEPIIAAGEVVTTTVVKVSVALTTDVTKDGITMAQALAAIKRIKPKVVVLFFHKQKQSQIPTVSSSKDKGKAKMIEPEVPIKRKEQMRIDEEYVRKLKAKEQEAARLSRAQQDEEANNSWDNMQAMMDADRLLAEKLQAREREELFEVQRQDCRYKQSHLKRRSFDKIKKLFDKEMTKVDENVEPVIDDSEELRKCMEIVPDDGDEVLIEATLISSRSPTIIDYKIYKEGKKNYFKIIKADGNS